MKRLQSETDRLRRRVNQLELKTEALSFWRILAFAISTGLALIIGWTGLPPMFQCVTALGFGIFALLVVQQDRIQQALILFRKRLLLSQQTHACAVLDWSRIPDLPPFAQEKPLPRYFADLDLLNGHALLRLINHTVSTSGFGRLIAQFQSNGITAQEISRRQKVCEETHRLRVLRRRFLVIESLWSGLIESDRILELLERPLHTGRAYVYFAVLAAIQASFLGLFVYFSVAGGKPFFLLSGIFLLLAYRASSREVRLLEAYDYGMSLDVSLGKFAALAQVVGKMERAAGPHLKPLLEPFSGEKNPQRLLARAGRVVGFLGVRQNYILHIAVNLFVPWDFYWTLRLEKLRREVQSRLPLWLTTLAELEVFVSLAEFQAAHPDYVFAEMTPEAPFYLKGQEIGHPLIAPEVRIGNELTLDPKHRCVIVTGSNMSGKSTFLRSLGVNLLLAKAGAVVCASKLQLRCLDLATSIRLNDSLEEGMSAFYAEVQQIKTILEQSTSGKPLLYLIDEVFRGTNNRERLIGSQAFVRRIAKSEACGLITTHDLELASLATESPAILNAHFRESIDGDRMSFHYKLADGPCPTTNALRVMQLAGLPID